MVYLDYTTAVKSAARDYLRRGLSPVPVPLKEKNPGFTGWQRFKLTADQVDDVFGEPKNIGLLLGDASGGLVDIDVDAPEARRLASRLLLDTAAVFGRPGAPRSHYLYTVGDPGRVMRLQDPTKVGEDATLVEWRANGGQSIVPPSLHKETGEQIVWYAEGDPFEVDRDELLQAVNRLAAAALLVRHWPDGARHVAALHLAGGLLSNGWPVDDVRALVAAIAEASGDAEVADRLTAVDTTAARIGADQPVTGWRSLAKVIDPRVVHRVRDWLGATFDVGDLAEQPTPTAPASTQAADGAPAFLALTDIGNAERLVEAFGDRLRYCRAWHAWLIWDGRRWSTDERAEVELYAKAVVRGIAAEVEAVKGDDLVAQNLRRSLRKWARMSEGDSRIMSLLRRAAAEEGIAVAPGDLDVDAWLLNVENGTVDLRTGELRPHNRADLITKLAPVTFDPTAAAPTWSAFLARILAGDAELVDLLQRIVGYCLTGSTRERLFFIAHGQGDNGKSVLTQVIAAMLGDYAMRTPIETIMERRDSGIPNDVARLRGARFVYASESERNARLAVARVKDFASGGDRITARFMRAEFFEFEPTFKLFVHTNHRPRINDSNKAIWNRLRLLPFDVTIPKAEQDTTLAERLRLELPGILNWALVGCLRWQAEGMTMPAKVAAANAAYRLESDDVGRWLAECCVVDAQATIVSRAAQESFRAFTGAEKVEPRSFAAELRERGFRDRHAKAGTTWRGFRLKTTEELPGDDGQVTSSVTDDRNDSNSRFTPLAPRDTYSLIGNSSSLLSSVTDAPICVRCNVDPAVREVDGLGWVCDECYDLLVGADQVG